MALRERAPDGMTAGQGDAVGAELARRRRSYLAACGLGLVATSTGWLFLVLGGHGTPLDAVSLPVVTLGLAGSIVMLLRRGGTLERTEMFLMLLTSVSLVCKIADIFLHEHAAGRHDLAPFADLFPWLPLVPVLGAVVFRFPRWLGMTLVFYGAVTALAAAHVVPGLASGTTTAEAYLVVRALLANAALTLLLAVGVRFHAQYLRAMAHGESMRALAFTDALTELPNRRGIEDSLRREISRSSRYRRELAIVVFDIDHFKRVNDVHGHAGGDRALKAVAGCVRAKLRASDALGRWGGEEFLVVAPETGSAGAASLAEKLRAAVEALAPEGLGVITASWGVAVLSPTETLESVVQRADAALYDAKSAGRNRVVSAPAPALAPSASQGAPTTR